MNRAGLAPIAAALIAVALFALRAPPQPGVFMRDFEAYYGAGRAFDAGANPYSTRLLAYERAVPGVSATRNELLPFVGAPPTLPLWGLLARLPYGLAARLWLLVLVASLVALLTCVLRFCDVSLVSLDGGIVALCALAFTPITSDYSLGQPALVGCAAAVLAVLLSARSTVGTGVALMAGAVQPNVVLAAFPLVWRKRGAIAVGCAALGLYAIGALTSGPAWPLAYIAVLRAHGIAERFDAIQYSPAAIAYGWGATPHVAAAIGLFVAFAALIAAAAAFARSHDIVARFAIASTALPLIAGFVHEHDFALLFFPALWGARAVRAAWRPAAVVAFGFLCVNTLDFAQQPKAAAQDVVLAAGALLALLAWMRARRWVLFATAALTLAIVIGAGWFGTTHPAPIWPNDMTALHLPADASPAQTWHAEQRSTGLERIEPAWALLRTIPLTGSMLLLALVGFKCRRPSCYRTGEPHWDGSS